jgi:cytochrome c oxidase subunit 2
MNIWWLPENISAAAGSVDFLFTLILITTGIAFVLVEGLLIYFLYRYRHREGQKATYVHGHWRLELAWTLFPALILFSLAIYQRGPWLDLKARFPSEDEAVVVELSPKQFEWHVRYPGPDGQFGRVAPELVDKEENPLGLDPNDPAGADDIIAPNNALHVPVNQRVLVLLKAQDVIHSFYVPTLRVKQDAVPGMTIRTWFEAAKTGRYEIACAELCGLGHYRMRAFLTVESQAEFEAWLEEVKATQ